jgi:hypothetical protein
MHAFAAILALATSAFALQVTQPTNTTGFSNSGMNTVSWNRVNTDPTNFTIVLVNKVCGLVRLELSLSLTYICRTCSPITSKFLMLKLMLVQTVALSRLAHPAPVGPQAQATRSTWRPALNVSTPFSPSPTTFPSMLLTLPASVVAALAEAPLVASAAPS